MPDITSSGAGIEIENLRAFRRDLRASEAGTSREMTTALREAGRPVLERVRQVAAVGRRPKDPHPGLLRRSYSIRTAGSSAFLGNKAPYAAGAEWGLHGKWKGFRKYPAFGTGGSRGRGRFAWRAVVERQDQVQEIVTERLREVIQIHGWAREG